MIGSPMATTFAMNNARYFNQKHFPLINYFPPLGYTVLAGSTYPEGNICVGVFASGPLGGVQFEGSVLGSASGAFWRGELPPDQAKSMS